MTRRDLLLFSLAAGGALSIAWAVFSPKSDEERVAEQLHALADAVHFSEPILNPLFWGTRVAEKMEPLTSPSLILSLAEIGGSPPTERRQLALAGAQMLSRYGSFEVHLEDLNIRLNETGAQAWARARTLANEAGQIRSDTRKVHFRLDKASSDYLITHIEVESPDHSTETNRTTGPLVP